jgi:hypothetical protein
MLAGAHTTFNDLVNETFGDHNARFYHKDYCVNMRSDKSWIRLYTPNKNKLGGGHRVKRIFTRDNWNTMTGESGSLYGQEYSYKTKEDGKEISSGVASYEPSTGGDENTMRQPVNYVIEKKWAPNDLVNQEAPLGEMYYPSPIVGYSKVTIKNISSITGDGNDCKTGLTEYEFYTSKDFPTKVNASGADTREITPKPINKFTIFSTIYKSLNVAEGFVIKLNDMHGKLKAISLYPDQNSTTAVSGTKYFYNVNSNGDLSQQVRVINELSQVDLKEIGKNIDVTTDLRKNQSINFNSTQTREFNVTGCGFPEFNNSFSFGIQVLAFKSAVNTKIVQQFGVLSKVEAFDDQSHVTTENVLWDKETGNVVLTKTTNNFNDPVYNFKYPAYWMYRGMGGAYKRQDICLAINSLGASTWDASSGLLSAGFVNNILHEGDELALTNYPMSFVNATIPANPINKKCWLVKQTNLTDYYLVDEDGNRLNASSLAYSGKYYLQVLRPAEHNQTDASSGGISTLHNPLTPNGTDPVPVLNHKILNASASEYCDVWNINACVNSDNNPYTLGYKGKWRESRSYRYKTSRSYDQTQPNVRTDGTYSDYDPFWYYNGSAWETVYDVIHGGGKWVALGENTKINPYGNLVETKNALNIYSSKLYSFNNTLLNADIYNAKECQTAFESFEDIENYYKASWYTNTHSNGNFNPYACDLKHLNNFDFITGLNNKDANTPTVVSLQAHTGRYSVEFKPNQQLNKTYEIQESIPAVISLHGYQCSSLGTNIRTGKLVLEPGKYIVSLWAKTDQFEQDNASFLEFDVIDGSGSIITNQKKTNIINSWQKFDYEFRVTSSSGQVSIHIKDRGSKTLYLDDIRLHPFNATMVAKVYDPYSLRLWADLDDRNYASIMEYDKSGALVRSKKETIKGIYTIIENRSSSLKK